MSEHSKEFHVVPYVPRTMLLPEGAKLCARHLKAKGMPSMVGWLFITLTIDRALFDSPHEAYEELKPKLNYFMKQMRRAGFNKSRRYIKKLEFHADEEGWPHWHLVVEERSFVHFSLVNKWWPHGMTDIRRVDERDQEFDYLFKYICKDGSIPDWILDNYKRVRFLQTWGIFESEEGSDKKHKDAEERSREEPLLREKLRRWSRKTTIVEYRHGEVISVTTQKLIIPFEVLWGHMIDREDIATYWQKILFTEDQLIELGYYLKTKEQDNNERQ